MPKYVKKSKKEKGKQRVICHCYCDHPQQPCQVIGAHYRRDKLHSKKAATAPPSIISNLSSKPGKEKCVLTPSTTTAGIVPSHTNILSNSLKLKGKVPLSTENLRNLNDSCELYSESGEADEGDIPEIDAHSVSSDCSDETEYTSMTEIKDRASTCTLVRNP